jgi:tRNA (cmo5U34)-methyltransferase
VAEGADKGASRSVGDGLSFVAGGWSFAGAADVFEEHFRKSVPFAEEGRAHVAELARTFLRPGAVVYELGISTGALAREVLRRSADLPIRYVGVDIVPAMAARAADALRLDPRFLAVAADATVYGFRRAALILSYYTLQFIPPAARRRLVRALFDSLEPGGALIAHEKVRETDAARETGLRRLHGELKLRNGFTGTEIAGKARALEGVLVPFTSESNVRMLRGAGFSTVEVIQRTLCFDGYLAVRRR